MFSQKIESFIPEKICHGEPQVAFTESTFEKCIVS